jgi:hypothetical protein
MEREVIVLIEWFSYIYNAVWVEEGMNPRKTQSGAVALASNRR